MGKPRQSVAYRFIAKQHVNVGHDLHEVVLEKLADEGRREVQAEQLVIFRGMLCHFQNGLQRDSQEETLEGTNDTESTHICFFQLRTRNNIRGYARPPVDPSVGTLVHQFIAPLTIISPIS